MAILSKLKAKKLTSQITCTSYYDFLTCGHHCLESLDCRDIPFDPPIQKKLKCPPGLPKHGVKYFGVDDNAAEWYLDTRALKVKKPLSCRRKFCLRFRVPIRSAKAATYSVPGRRVSPEFLSLLKQNHARKPGLEKLPRKYRSRKPSFACYKYDAEGKRREMRPGIDTAAPLEFPSRDANCTCVSPMERDLMAYRRHISQGSKKLEEAAKASGLYPFSVRTKRNKKRSVHFERDKGDEKDIYKDMEQQKQCQGECLKNLQDRDNLQENVANQDKAGLGGMYNPMTQPLQFHGPPKPAACSSKPTFSPMENVTTGVCPFGQQGTGCLRSCDYSKCPSQKWRFGRYRDPCSVEYKNSPFFKAIQGSSYGECSRSGGTKPRNCSQCISENMNITKMCAACKEKTLKGSGNKEQSCIEVQAPPDNSCCAPPISYQRQLGVDCSQGTHLTNENGVEIPGNSTEFKGFVHRLGKENMLNQDGAINTQKPKPCCHLFSSVDPDTRQAEMERLAKLKFSETKPDSCNWSKRNREICEQGKSNLADNDEQPSQNPISNCFGSDKSQSPCPCKNPSCPQSVGKHSSDSFPKTLRKCNTGSKEQIGSYTLLSQAKEPPQPPQSSGESQKKLVSILKKTTTDWERSIPKKARLFPRLHAFAKRFLWSGPKSHRLKSDKSDNERSDNYSSFRKVDKSNPYCIRHLSSDDSDARQGRSTKAEHVRFDFSDQENQAISSVIKRITFQDQARIQDVRGPRDTSLWTKFHQAKPRQRSCSPEIYRNSRSRRNEATKATRPDPNRLDSRSRKRSNTPLSSSPERDGNKRSRYPRQKPLHSPNRAQTRTHEQPCSAECAQKARNYRRVQGNGITSPGIQDRGTSRIHDNEELVSSSGYETPHERHRGRGPQQRISRVQFEREERQVQKKTKKHCAGCKSCNNYSNTSRASESSCPRYRRETVPYSHTESQAKSTKPSSSQPRGYRSPVSKDQENSPRRLQIKRRHCDQTCLAQAVSRSCKLSCQSRRMRGGIDYREDDYIPGSNQDVPHSFPTNLPPDTDSYQQVNYTKDCKSSMHAFCFD